MEYSMRKAYQRILNIKLHWLIIALVAVGASIFLLGGGVYNIIVKPPLFSKWIPFAVDYRLNEQVLSESIIVMLLYTIGFIGFVAIYQSTKYTYKPRQAIILLLVGAVLVILAYFICENIISRKLWVPL